ITSILFCESPQALVTENGALPVSPETVNLFDRPRQVDRTKTTSQSAVTVIGRAKTLLTVAELDWPFRHPVITGNAQYKIPAERSAFAVVELALWLRRATGGSFGI